MPFGNDLVDEPEELEDQEEDESKEYGSNIGNLNCGSKVDNTYGEESIPAARHKSL